MLGYDNDMSGFRAADKAFGRFVFHNSLPSAVRSLDDEELRTLVLALLREWRDRAELADGLM
jgi:hypothetical protein